MGLSSAIDWWDEWKLRILVLCSLFVQFFLYFAEIVRGRYVLRRLRVMVWIAYIGGDALAIYALATLFNRQKQHAAGGGGNDALEVLWAPVLLIHLGGQEISAYSLEDNELWKRHAITMVSQITVALYVFCKWWSGDKRLLQAAILLFIIGILRFSQKPWALRKASFRTMASATNLSSRPRDARSISAWTVLRNCFLEGEVPTQEENTDDSCSLEEYVKRTWELVEEGAKVAASDESQQSAELEKSRHAAKYIYRLFLDLSSPYSVRLQYLHYFLKFDDKFEHKVLRKWILSQFFTMYTKQRSSHTGLGLCLFILVLGMALAPVVLFAESSKDGYSKSDITVTYILFSGTAVLQLAPLWCGLSCFLLFGRVLINMGKNFWWPDVISQHNIMLFCARKKKPTSALMKLDVSRCLRGYINKHWYIWHEPVALHVDVLVRRHIVDGWKEHIRDDPATYRRFSNLRGEQTLRKHHLLEQLGWSFNLPFDECVLVWHVATDMCIFHRTNTPAAPSRRISEIISNHMIHLLFICPEMLMLGTRHDLFLIACDDIEAMIKDDRPPSSLLDERSIAQWILGRVMEQSDDLLAKAPVIYKAHKLAKALIDLNNDGRMWEVIQGVWVEMLCYSASRSRGYEHAKSLAYGGEYLTNVWLLWSVMGMETLPDKMQNNTGPLEERAAAAAAAAASV